MARKANALYVLGRIDEARGLIEKAISLRPHDSASLRDVESDEALLPPATRRRDDGNAAIKPRSTVGAQQADLHFALGKAYDDSGEADRAFPHFAKGNALKRRQIDYDESGELAGKASIAHIFTPATDADKAGQGDKSDRPIFIIGMPRAGTTLVEQILASHPAVFGAGEQKNFGEAVAALIRPGQPDYPSMVPP